MDLGLAPPFLGRFDRRHRFANAAPSVIELAEFGIGPRQIDQYDGTNSVAPVDRNAVIPEVIIWTASEALPVRANAQPWCASRSLPEHGALFVRQERQVHRLVWLLLVVSAEDVECPMRESACISVAAWPNLARILERVVGVSERGLGITKQP